METVSSKNKILEIARISFCKNVDSQTVPSQRTVEEVSLECRLNERLKVKSKKFTYPHNEI